MFPVGKDGEREARESEVFEGELLRFHVMSRHPPSSETCERWDPGHPRQATGELFLLPESWPLSRPASCPCLTALLLPQTLPGKGCASADPGSPWIRGPLSTHTGMHAQHDVFPKSRNHLIQTQNRRCV